MIVTQILFPEITSTVANACPVDGSWKDAQESVIDTTRIAIDMIFGASGLISLIGLMNIFGGKRS